MPGAAVGPGAFVSAPRVLAALATGFDDLGERCPLALRGRGALRRTRTTGESGAQPRPRVLQIGEQARRQIPQRLQVQRPEIGFIELTQAVFAQVHGQR